MFLFKINLHILFSISLFREHQFLVIFSVNWFHMFSLPVIAATNLLQKAYHYALSFLFIPEQFQSVHYYNNYSISLEYKSRKLHIIWIQAQLSMAKFSILSFICPFYHEEQEAFTANNLSKCS